MSLAQLDANPNLFTLDYYIESTQNKKITLEITSAIARRIVELANGCTRCDEPEDCHPDCPHQPRDEGADDESAVQAMVEGMRANTGTMHGMAIGALAAIRSGKVPGLYACKNDAEIGRYHVAYCEQMKQERDNALAEAADLRGRLANATHNLETTRLSLADAQESFASVVAQRDQALVDLAAETDAKHRALTCAADYAERAEADNREINRLANIVSDDGDRIAALPALLAVAEALRNIERNYTQLIESGDSGNYDPQSVPVIAQARAALAKLDEVKHD